MDLQQVLTDDDIRAMDNRAPAQPRAVPQPLIPRTATPQTPAQESQSAASAAASAANANRTTAITPAEVAGQNLENQGRQRELQMPAGMSDATTAIARDRVIAARQLREQLRQAEANFRPYEGTTTLGEMIPFVNTTGLATAESSYQRMMPLIRRLFRSPDASTTEQENAYYEALIPSVHAYDTDNRQRIDNLYRMLDSLESEYSNVLPAGERRPVLGGAQVQAPAPVNPNLVQPGESMGQVGNLPPLTDSERAANAGGNQLDNSGGLYLTQQDRTRADQIASHTTAMARAGKTPEEINQWLATQGIQPISPDAATMLNNYRRQRRTQDFPGFSPNYVPTGRTDPNLTTGVANTSYGAGVIAAGDALTFGLLDNATADPERTRAGMELLREEHPIASTIGEAAGSLVPGAAIERGVGYGLRALNELRGGSTIARLGGELRTVGEMAQRPLGNAIYGGAYGMGSADEGNRFAGGMRGALLSIAGGEVGDRATAGLGRAFTGTRDAGVRYLTERGIPVTIGQIASRGGIAARTLTRVENALESVPWLGEAIRQRRMEGVRAVNEAAFDDALSSIGGTTGGNVGEEGVQRAQAAVGNAYDQALNNVRVSADNDFVTEMGAAINLGKELPTDLQAHFRNFIETRLAHEMADGELTGLGYQALRQELREERAAIRGQLGARAYGTAIKRVEGALERLVQRGAPDAVPALRAADQAYRHTRVVEGAVGRAINNKQEGGVFTPAQLGLEARTNANRFGNNAATTNRPFYELQRNAQNVLPSTLPNSGTADRTWVLAAFPAIASGAAYQTGLVDEKTAALFAGLGLPYTRHGQQLFQKMLVSRPDRVRRVGEAILRQRGLVGRAGGGAINPVTDETPSPTPP